MTGPRTTRKAKLTIETPPAGRDMEDIVMGSTDDVMDEFRSTGITQRDLTIDNSAYTANDFLDALAGYDINLMEEIKTILKGEEKISKARGDIVLKMLDKIFANPATKLDIHQRQEQIKVSIDMGAEGLTREEWQMIMDDRAKGWKKETSAGYQDIDKMRIDRGSF